MWPPLPFFIFLIFLLKKILPCLLQYCNVIFQGGWGLSIFATLFNYCLACPGITTHLSTRWTSSYLLLVSINYPLSLSSRFSLSSLFCILTNFKNNIWDFHHFAWKEIILTNLLNFCKKTSTIETFVTRHQRTFANGKKKLTTLNKNNRFS